MTIQQSKREIGSNGESIAEIYLINKSHRVIDKNYYTKYGEIDLITQKGDTIYFYEIKLRNTTQYGSGIDAITSSKISKIKKTAQIWINENYFKYKNYFFVINALSIDGEGEVEEF